LERLLTLSTCETMYERVFQRKEEEESKSAQKERSNREKLCFGGEKKKKPKKKKKVKEKVLILPGPPILQEGVLPLRGLRKSTERIKEKDHQKVTAPLPGGKVDR